MILMTSRDVYVPPPGPRRRASDLEVITLDELGNLAPFQRLAVIQRDMALKEAMPSAEALLDASLRQKFVDWNMTEALVKLDAAIADRRAQESYGVVLETNLNHMLDAAVRGRHGEH